MSHDLNEIKDKITSLSDEHLELLTSAQTPPLLEQLVVAYKKNLLATLHEHFSGEEPPTPKEIKILLQANWDLINGTVLAYTALPQDSLTLLLCDIAVWVAQETGDDPVQVLMPSLIAVDSCHDPVDSPVLDSAHDQLLWVLKNHILSECGRYLLPVSLLLELNADTNLAEIRNPYGDDASETSIYLTSGELTRLFKHSGAATSLGGAYNNLALELNTKHSLFWNLNQLVRSGNSEYSKKVKDGSAYEAMLDFCENYFPLWEGKKQEIPQTLIKHIDEFRKLAPTRDKMVTANISEKNLIDREYRGIQTEIQRNEKLSSDIVLDDQHKTKQVHKAKLELEQAQQVLRESLIEGQYTGQDTGLPITTQLLDAFDLELHLPENQQDLTVVLNSLSDEAFERFFEGTNLANLVMTKIEGFDDFLVLLNTLSAEKIKILLKNASELSNVVNERHLTTLLQTFDGAKCHAICEGVHDQMIQNFDWDAPFPASISFVLRFVSAEEHTEVYNALKDQLHQFMKSEYSNDFRNVMKLLNETQRTKVYHALKNSLPQIIKESPALLRRALEFINDAQRTEVYDAVKEDLPQLIKNGHQFLHVLYYLNPTQRTEVYEEVKQDLPQLINDGTQFRYILHCLNPTQRTEVYDTVKKDLPQLIQNTRQLKDALKPLNSTQRTEVYNALEKDLPKLLLKNKFSYLKTILELLKPEQGAKVHQSLKEDLPQLIDNTTQLKNALSNLDSKQRTELYQSLKPDLPKLIKDGHQFGDTLEFLSRSQRTEVYQAVKQNLPQLIQNTTQLESALRHLTRTQRKDLAVLLGRKKLKTILDKWICLTDYRSSGLKDYREELLTAYQIIRQNETQEYFFPTCFGLFKQWSRTEKLAAVGKLLDGDSDARGDQQGLLGKINLATR